MSLKLVSPKRAFNSREAARYIGKSYSWLAKKRLRGSEDPGEQGPRYRKSSTGQALYFVEDLDAYLESLSDGLAFSRSPKVA